MTSFDNDATARERELLRLHYIAECGQLFVSFGAAICAAAAAENREVLQLTLRHARGTLLEAISEFKALGKGAGND